MKNSELLLIFGAPRSGTTWLWGLLTSHKEITPLTCKDLRINKESSESGVFIIEPDQKIKPIIDNKLNKINEKYLLEKTPEHTLYFSKIIKLYPKAKFIFITRDIPAIISSMLNSKFYNFATDVNHALRKVKQYTTVYKQISGLPNVYRLTYGELITSPYTTLETLFYYLELPTSEEEIKKIISENHGKVKVNIPGAYRKGALESWKEDLSQSDQQIIWEAMHNENINWEL